MQWTSLWSWSYTNPIIVALRQWLQIQTLDSDSILILQHPSYYKIILFFSCRYVRIYIKPIIKCRSKHINYLLSTHLALMRINTNSFAKFEILQTSKFLSSAHLSISNTLSIFENFKTSNRYMYYSLKL